MATKFVIIHVPKDRLIADGGQWTDVALDMWTEAELAKGVILNHSFTIAPDGDGFISVAIAT